MVMVHPWDAAVDVSQWRAWLAAGGYHQLTALVRPTWHRWTSAEPSVMGRR